ncbi:MAG: SHOCT domain-containing protein [Campylobacterota bacterium]|nr:SHOCT domain-containing protein [Campylobacterota bacterium]
MQKLTPEGQNLVNNLSSRYNLSADAIIHMIGAVNNGGGTMAQFNSPELGGSGQWMQGGMTMVGDMFNSGLKMTVDSLCSEISNALITTQVFPIAPPGTRASNQWWPTDLGIPFSSGGQNNIRYAVFPQRLAVELNGEVTVYDTLDHNIGGVSQQQGGDTSLTFSSQYGTISVTTLPIISGSAMPPAPQTNFAQATYSEPTQNDAPNPIEPQIDTQSDQSTDTIINLIEKLSELHAADALTDSEFNTKKSELLSRL